MELLAEEGESCPLKARHDVGIGQADLLGRRLAEHHVELRVAEDEGVVLVDERNAGVAAERFGQESRELETAEARAQNDETRLHRGELNPPA